MQYVDGEVSKYSKYMTLYQYEYIYKWIVEMLSAPLQRKKF